MAGLWKVDTDEGAEMPFRVTGTDSFHASRARRSWKTPDGEKIPLVAGGIYSFPDGFIATWRTRSPFLKFFVIA